MKFLLKSFRKNYKSTFKTFLNLESKYKVKSVEIIRNI